ncbi:MAG: hypothetical protein IKY13_01595, partial [Bacteroidaceae bacterium]|nr:hypothetical protein [Bacteroidaceae bacterium]
MKIAIFGKQYQISDRDVLQQLFDTLTHLKCEICIEKEFLDMISQDNYLHTPSPISLIKSCDFEADMALSIGGD